MGSIFSKAKDEAEAAAEGIKPSSDRKCRDIIFIPLFLCFWVGMFVVAAVAVDKGNPERLIYGTGYDGEVCGSGGRGDYIFYPHLHDDLLYAQSRGIAPIDMDFYGVCVDECPQTGTWTCNYDTQAEIDAELEADPSLTVDVVILSRSRYRENCWYAALDSTDVFFRCLQETQTDSLTLGEECLYPTNVPASSKLCQAKKTQVMTNNTGPTESDPLMEQLSTNYMKLGRAGSDINKTLAEILIIGALVPLVLSLIWLVLLRLFAGVMVWFTVVAVLVMSIVFTLFLLSKGGVITAADFEAVSGQELDVIGVSTDDPKFQADKNNEDIFRICGWIMAGISALLLLLIIALRKKIRIAVGIFREGSKAIGHMMLVLLFPLVQFVFTVALWIYFIVIGAYIYSMADDETFTPSDFTTTLTDDDLLSSNIGVGNDTSVIAPGYITVGQFLAGYHFFGFLWTNQVIQAIGMCTVAGGISAYYWSEHKTTEEIGRTPVLTAFVRVFRYHIGSLIFGSLIIAIVQFIRAVLAYIDKKTQRLQNTNMALKVAMKCIQCCMWCFEKCLKFLSRNAYIIIAMKGTGFCSAAWQSFWLIFHNLFQIGAVNVISMFLLLLGRVTITAACAIIMFLAVDANDDYAAGGEDELSYPMAPIIVTACIAWFIASMFMNVYDLAVDTILLCFCEDKKVNEKSGKYFMSDELRKYIGARAREASETETPAEEGGNKVNPLP